MDYIPFWKKCFWRLHLLKIVIYRFMNNIFSPRLWAHTIWATTTPYVSNIIHNNVFILFVFYSRWAHWSAVVCSNRLVRHLRDIEPRRWGDCRTHRGNLMWRDKDEGFVTSARINNCRSRGCSVTPSSHLQWVLHPGSLTPTVSFITWTSGTAVSPVAYEHLFTSPLRARGCWSG